MARQEEYLCCPTCKSDLKAIGIGLHCDVCHRTFDVQEGIPILVDLEGLPAHLTHQVRYFEEERIMNTKYRLLAWQSAYMQRFVRHFPDISGKVILDCGTGPGYMAIELAKKGATVIACDLTLKSLIRLKNVAERNKVAQNIILVCSSAEELPMKTECIDYFISNAVLEHLPRESQAIEEINRVCKPEAGIMITVPLSYRYLNPLLLPINMIHDKRIGHLRRYHEGILLKKFVDYRLLASYYTGHTAKVFKVLLNLIFPIFNEKNIEQKDEKKERHVKWASNIICFLSKPAK